MPLEEKVRSIQEKLLSVAEETPPIYTIEAYPGTGLTPLLRRIEKAWRERGRYLDYRAAKNRSKTPAGLQERIFEALSQGQVRLLLVDHIPTRGRQDEFWRAATEAFQAFLDRTPGGVLVFGQLIGARYAWFSLPPPKRILTRLELWTPGEVERSWCGYAAEAFDQDLGVLSNWWRKVRDSLRWRRYAPWFLDRLAKACRRGGTLQPPEERETLRALAAYLCHWAEGYGRRSSLEAGVKRLRAFLSSPSSKDTPSSLSLPNPKLMPCFELKWIQLQEGTKPAFLDFVEDWGRWLGTEDREKQLLERLQTEKCEEEGSHGG